MNLECGLCPHNCRLSPGQFGLCKVRSNQDNKIVDVYAGFLSAASMDPIEKKPLYHFHPGKQILSLGFYGCSFKCSFCQNHNISQHSPEDNKVLTPEAAVQLALDHGSFGIAYTYSEPTVHHEWLLETAELASKHDLKNVLISNGYLNKKAASEIINVMDAANIDLKGYTESFYQELGGNLEPVKNFIAQSHDKLHLEVTTLVVPGENDSFEEIANISSFISSLSPAIPYHLSAYYPQYQYKKPPTDPNHLLLLIEEAKKTLNFVYAGNISNGDNNTYCPKCGGILVERNYYNTTISGIFYKKCKVCKKQINFIAN